MKQAGRILLKIKQTFLSFLSLFRVPERFPPEVSVPKLSQCIICLLCSHIETCHWSFVLAIDSFPGSASLCLHFSMTPLLHCSKAWGTMVEFGKQSVSLWCADKRIEHSHMTESSSACPLRKRKWLDPSLKDVFSPLQWVLWTIQTKRHVPILFWVTSGDIISVLVYLEVPQCNHYPGSEKAFEMS